MKNILKHLGIARNRLHPAAIISITVIALLIIGAFSTQAAIYSIYHDRILPGVTVGDRSLGRLTIAEARHKLLQITDALQEKGISACFEDRCIVIDASATAINDPDLNYPLFVPHIDEAIAKAYSIGRRGNIVTRFIEEWKLRKRGIHVSMDWDMGREKITEYLASNFSENEQPAKNIDLVITPNGSQYQISFTAPQQGRTFNYIAALAEIEKSLENLESPSVRLSIREEVPIITSVNEEALANEARSLIEGMDWRFTYEDDAWSIRTIDGIQALELQQFNGATVIGFNRDAFEENLLARPKALLEKQPRDARFEIENGRVVEFQSGADGIDIVETATWQKANELLQNATSSTLSFPLSVVVVPSDKSIGSINNLGITERIAVGRSNFSGSPANRRHNINVGSQTLNGILIKPDEEFSLITALGEIDGASGYLPELVIKGNETIPEYGGGLCQVGTTMFRTTLDGGLPITQRRNHSYRVSYYEPAGTDATIYDPWPDFRFINDTGNHILIQTHMEGDELVYEFWGTSDGRVAEMTDPVIYNITEPPPTKYVETLDLPPGEIKCTERAHRGADASFDYTVTYPDGEIKEETFISHYRPWQEVCLIGVEELSTPEDELMPEEAPTTEPINSLN